MHVWVRMCAFRKQKQKTCVLQTCQNGYMCSKIKLKNRSLKGLPQKRSMLSIHWEHGRAATSCNAAVHDATLHTHPNQGARKHAEPRRDPLKAHAPSAAEPSVVPLTTRPRPSPGASSDPPCLIARCPRQSPRAQRLPPQRVTCMQSMRRSV